MDQLKYDSLYSGLVSINKSLGGTQSMPDSEYGAMIDLMETLSGQPVGESGDAFDAVSTVATMAENGELPIQGGGDEKESISEAGVKFGYSTFSTAPNKYRYDSISDASYMFYSCKNLAGIPDDFNFAGIVDGSYAFSRCTKLTGTLRDIYLTNAVCVDEMFSRSGITTVENFSAPSVDEYGYADAFASCPNLTSINGISFDTAISANGMFKNCRSLKTIQNFSMPNVTDIGEMFYNCASLESVPVFDTSNVTYAADVFRNCTSLQHIPSMNLSKCNFFSGSFFGCTNLQSIGEIDLSGATQPPTLFNANMELLTDLGGFPGLSVGFNEGYGLNRCPNLSKTSIENVVNNLKDVSSTGTIQTLYLSTSVQDKVDEQITSTATAKGWAIAFNIIEN